MGLGLTEVYLDGRLLVPSDWTFAKPKELLFYLASNLPKTKEQIGLVFWPDASPDQLRAGLRAALYHLRQALGRREWVIYEDGVYRFNQELDTWYDVEAFRAGIELAETRIQNAPFDAVEALERAIELYRGDFLADIATDDWATLQRAELRRQYLTAMKTLADLYAEQGNSERTIEILLALLDADNLIESAYRGLMRVYASQGERGLALRQYERLVSTLQDQLGVSPSPESTELYRSLQASTD